MEVVCRFLSELELLPNFYYADHSLLGYRYAASSFYDARK